MLKIKEKLKNYSDKSLLRTRRVIAKRHQGEIEISGLVCVNFASNDYLGLAQHPDIKQAFIKGVTDYGFGSSASPLVSGFYQPQKELEEKWAEFLNRESAIFFNSGYLANLGVISTLASRDTIVISDKLCHASLLDGIQLSRALHYRFPHQDLFKLESMLRDACKPALVVTESVFSMEGAISPIKQIAAMTKDKGILVVDDAHGIGILGDSGAGICEHDKLSVKEVPVLITPLGKAMGGMGAMVSGSKELIETILQFSRHYRYSTALPPAVAMANLTALKLLKQETYRLEKLQILIKFFVNACIERMLPLVSSDLTPIKSIPVLSNDRALSIQQGLMNQGFYVAVMRPPTVPLGQICLRISLNSNLEENHILKMLDALARLYVRHSK